MKGLHGHTACFYFCAGAAAVLLLPQWLVWAAVLMAGWLWWCRKRRMMKRLPES